ncbi:DUF2889 domain-containing protein [Denitromonas halophila]|uniref:DUF2889 domain-containing protein n=1 Tax=Denitromonas halophila TaxID=1629404 RepID=A0A557QY85_9RHOO|nr:DUF2889 domain-containing protein [Denitromonas halophila]TVO57884.1 DUF2889 domain-containing protein [Denitromonas halophila]
MNAKLSGGVGRQRAQVRRIEVEGFFRDDGLVELDATLVDLKDVDYPLAAGVRKKGDPVHRMHVSVLIDHGFTILDAHAELAWVPYPGGCERIGPAYDALVGMNLMKGFREAIRAAFFGTRGCTHVSELLLSLPTAAVQTFATFMKDSADAGEKPFQLDRCHALATDGETVRQYYPTWYRPPAAGSGDAEDGDV